MIVSEQTFTLNVETKLRSLIFSTDLSVEIRNDFHSLDKKFDKIVSVFLISLVVCSSDRICVAAQ